ncbi:after-VIT domain-containing protein [Nostoc sp.]
MRFCQRYNSTYNQEIVFEFTINRSRVGRVVLDEKASTLKDPVVVEKIKRSLLLWRVSHLQLAKLS